MLQNPEHNLPTHQLDHTLGDVYETLDQLHSAVMEDNENGRGHRRQQMNKLRTLTGDMVTRADNLMIECMCFSIC